MPTSPSRRGTTARSRPTPRAISIRHGSTIALAWPSSGPRAFTSTARSRATAAAIWPSSPISRSRRAHDPQHELRSRDESADVPYAAAQYDARRYAARSAQGASADADVGSRADRRDREPGQRESAVSARSGTSRRCSRMANCFPTLFRRRRISCFSSRGSDRSARAWISSSAS